MKTLEMSIDLLWETFNTLPEGNTKTNWINQIEKNLANYPDPNGCCIKYSNDEIHSAFAFSWDKNTNLECMATNNIIEYNTYFRTIDEKKYSAELTLKIHLLCEIVDKVRNNNNVRIFTKNEICFLLNASHTSSYLNILENNTIEYMKTQFKNYSNHHGYNINSILEKY